MYLVTVDARTNNYVAKSHYANSCQLSLQVKYIFKIE